MAHCDEYSELISASLDGALSPAEAEKLNAHLALCPECKALYEELTALRAALSDLPPVEVPSDLTERIMAAVAAEQVLPFAPAKKKKAPIHWQRWLASAAVLAVVLMGTWGWKPWENTMTKDAKPESAAPAAQQSVAADSSTALPEASEAVEAAPEGVLADPAAGEAPDNAAAPDPASQALPTSGKSFAAKVSGGTADTSPTSEPDQTAAPTEMAVAPRMARMDPEPLLPETEGGSSDTGPAPALFSAPVPPQAVQATGVPAEENGVGTSQSLMTAANGTDAVESPDMSPREALDRLLKEYPMPGCETWEYEEIEEGWQSPEWTTQYGEQSWLEYSGPESYGDKTYHIFNEWVTPFDEAPESVGCPVSYAVLVGSGEIFLSGN